MAKSSTNQDEKNTQDGLLKNDSKDSIVNSDVVKIQLRNNRSLTTSHFGTEQVFLPKTVYTVDRNKFENWGLKHYFRRLIPSLD